MGTKLITIDTNKNKNELVISIRKWFQENGSLPFEHGFQAKKFIVRGNNKLKPYFINFWGILTQNTDTKKTYKVSWYVLSKKNLLDLVDECNRYYSYVINHPLPKGRGLSKEH